MIMRRAAAALLAVGAFGATAAGAHAQDERQTAVNTRADFTPFERFDPLTASAPCTGVPGGRFAEPFALGGGYFQQVIAEETDVIGTAPNAGPSEDLWDMNTQNEFGRDAGRYVYRTHEVAAAAAGAAPRAAGGAAVTVTDLATGVTRTLAERNDWERFDGIVWTPWGTILAAEEVVNQSARDPHVPQATGGLVYELFVDPRNPSRLDPSRERITRDDGTTDRTRDGIRVRPALGAKSHEGMRFDARGHLYSIAETRGRTSANQSGGIFRFVPDRRGDLSSGRLSALRTDDGLYGEGRWTRLARGSAQVDADREAENRGANQYERPEDVETGESTGVDRNNHGRTVYVAVTEGTEAGVIAIDVNDVDRPYSYQYVGREAGNVNAGFASADNLALDRRGNLAITEDPARNTVGADIWVAVPPEPGADDEYGGYRPALVVERFASLKDCAAEPTGIYFALDGTERYSRGAIGPLVGYDEDTINGRTLLVNRQHAGQTTTADQLVGITPERPRPRP